MCSSDLAAAAAAAAKAEEEKAAAAAAAAAAKKAEEEQAAAAASAAAKKAEEEKAAAAAAAAKKAEEEKAAAAAAKDKPVARANSSEVPNGDSSTSSSTAAPKLPARGPPANRQMSARAPSLGRQMSAASSAVLAKNEKLLENDHLDVLPHEADNTPEETEADKIFQVAVHQLTSGELKKSEKALFQVLEIYRSNPGKVKSFTVARVCRTLGEVLGNQNHLELAKKTFEMGVPHAVNLLEAGAPSGQPLKGTLLDYLGKTHIATEDYDDAFRCLEEALRTFEATSQDGNFQVMNQSADKLRLTLVDVLMAQEKTAEALSFADKEIAALSAKAAEYSKGAVEPEGGEKGAATAAKKGEEKDEDLTEEEKARKEGERRWGLARMLRHSALGLKAKKSDLLEHDGDLDGALKGLYECQEELASMHGKESERTMAMGPAIAHLHLMRKADGDLAAGKAIMEGVVAALEKSGNGEVSKPRVADANIKLGQYLMAAGDSKAAVAPIKKGVEILEGVYPGYMHRQVLVQPMAVLVKALENAGEAQEAKVWNKKLLQLRVPVGERSQAVMRKQHSLSNQRSMGRQQSRK